MMATRSGVSLAALALAWAGVTLLGASPAHAQLCAPGACQDVCSGGDSPDPAGCPAGESIYRVCAPPAASANGALLVFAHGYVAPGAPLQVPDYEVDGVPLSTLVTQSGFVYATSSFPVNGLAIQEGIADLADLTTMVRGACGLTGPAILAGASEGGAVAALGIERLAPQLFQGGLALCGPIGSFQEQINHYDDARVVFDYFFPGVLPGTAIDPDPTGSVRAGWSTYTSQIALALAANPSATQQLVKVLRVPVDPAHPAASVGEAVIGNLWYNVFGTYDAQAKLGGQPFDNRWRFYTGSNNDLRLNLRVKRYTADAAARLNIAANYETTGRLDAPVVTMHTTGDAIVPYWHEPLYRWKTIVSGSWPLHANLPVFKYGHCTFDAADAQRALGVLLFKMSTR
jgi:hypothetical protein